MGFQSQPFHMPGYSLDSPRSWPCYLLLKDEETGHRATQLISGKTQTGTQAVRGKVRAPNRAPFLLLKQLKR